MGEFNKCFAISILKNKQNNVKVEILSGVIVSIILISILSYNIQIANMLIIIYFAISNLMYMSRMEDFLSLKDIDVFGINSRMSKLFTYILQKVLNDTLIGNGILYFVVTVFCVIKGNYYEIIWIYLISAASHIGAAYINTYENEGIRKKSFIVLLTIAACILFVFLKIKNNLMVIDFLQVETMKSILPILVFVLVALIAYLKRFDNDVIVESVNYSGRESRIMKLIKKWDIFIYKDYKLVGSELLINVVVVLILFMLLTNKSNAKELFLMYSLIFLCTNFFTLKDRKKKCMLLNRDNFFYDIHLLFEDRMYMRKSKFKLIMTGYCWKTISSIFIFSALYLSGNQFNLLRYIFYLAEIAFVAAVLEFCYLYSENKVDKVFLIIVRYSVIVFCYMSICFGNFHILGLSELYSIFVLLLYSHTAYNAIKCNN